MNRRPIDDAETPASTAKPAGLSLFSFIHVFAASRMRRASAVTGLGGRPDGGILLDQSAIYDKLQQHHKFQQAMADDLRFYRADEQPYGAFSNLYRREFMFEGEVYPTAEHAYQAGKARKLAVREWLMNAPSPALLAMAAHGLYYWDIAPGWSKTKFDRMKRVLLAKFSTFDDLRELLLSTGKHRLVETATTDSPVNRLWGEVNGQGKNMLGVLLMEVREELRQSAARTVPKKKAPSRQPHSASNPA